MIPARLSIVSLSFLYLLTAITLAAENRTIIFHDNFENRTDIGDEYITALAGPDAWQIQDGVLIGKQTNPSHGAVIRKELPFSDIDIEVDFRFSGGSRFNFVIDDKNEKSVHAGHICRVSISPTSLKISDDKTGNMNLEIRALRQTENLLDKQQQALEALLKRTSVSAKLDLQHGEWYCLRVRIQNDLMEAYINDELIAMLRSPGVAHPTKTKFGMTVNEATIDFDNLEIFMPITH